MRGWRPREKYWRQQWRREQRQSEFPDIETSEGGGTASGQDRMAVSGEAQQEGTGGAAFDKLKTVYVACKAREDALYYFTTMYVGLTLLRTPVTANTGSPSHGKLKELVQVMGSVKKNYYAMGPRFSRSSLRPCVRLSTVLGKLRPLLR